MTMLSDADLAAYRTEFNNLLGGTCVVQRLSTTPNGMGGSTSSWAAQGTALCNISPMTGPQTVATSGDEVREVGARIVTLPAETDVTTSDRLLIDGDTYEVTDAREPRTYEFVRRVDAAKKEPES